MQTMSTQLSADSESEDETTLLFPSTHSSNEDEDEANILSDIMNETGIISPNSPHKPRAIIINFILLAVLFSANHGAVVSCLSLASGRLGDLGNYQSSVLYLAYTCSALFGSTFVVKNIGAKKSISIGMWLYCTYVGCFVIATMFPSMKTFSVILGATIGGISGGFLWTAQGSYLARASNEYAMAKGRSIEDATALFSGIFAGIYLGEEVVLKIFSSVMILHFRWSWLGVFSGYTVIALISSLLMIFITDFTEAEEEERENDLHSNFYKATVTFRLLAKDPKMKYMIPLNASFALSSVFLNTFVNSEVVRIVLKDSNSKYIGLLSSITSAVGGTMSVVFGYMAPMVGNDSILVMGCISFFAVSFCFFSYPSLSTWSISWVVFVYMIQGVGRATFEGSMKAEFAIVFPDKEAAFGNIVFQNGIMTTVGFLLMSIIHCNNQQPYCVEFNDGVKHYMLAFEVMVMISSIGAIVCYRIVKRLYEKEQEESTLHLRLIGEDTLL
jgi:MFS family permease